MGGRDVDGPRRPGGRRVDDRRRADEVIGGLPRGHARDELPGAGRHAGRRGTCGSREVRLAAELDKRAALGSLAELVVERAPNVRRAGELREKHRIIHALPEGVGRDRIDRLRNVVEIGGAERDAQEAALVGRNVGDARDPGLGDSSRAMLAFDAFREGSDAVLSRPDNEGVSAVQARDFGRKDRCLDDEWRSVGFPEIRFRRVDALRVDAPRRCADSIVPPCHDGAAGPVAAHDGVRLYAARGGELKPLGPALSARCAERLHEYALARLVLEEGAAGTVGHDAREFIIHVRGDNDRHARCSPQESAEGVDTARVDVAGGVTGDLIAVVLPCDDRATEAVGGDDGVVFVFRRRYVESDAVRRPAGRSRGVDPLSVYVVHVGPAVLPSSDDAVRAVGGRPGGILLVGRGADGDASGLPERVPRRVEALSEHVNARSPRQEHDDGASRPVGNDL